LEIESESRLLYISCDPIHFGKNNESQKSDCFFYSVSMPL
jgi:hypothetical protein